MKDGRFHASSAVVNPMYLGMHASDVAVFDGLAGPELLHAKSYQGWWIFNVRF